MKRWEGRTKLVKLLRLLGTIVWIAIFGFVILATWFILLWTVGYIIGLVWSVASSGFIYSQR